MTGGNETTGLSGDVANWTIDTELDFNEFKGLIERMFDIKKKARNNSRSRMSNSKRNATLAIDETSQSMIKTTTTAGK